MRRACAVLLLLIAAGMSCASEPVTVAEQARKIEGQVWSPYCPGRLLIDCTTQQAGELRDEIGRRLQAGEGADEVLRWIRLNYGDEALAAPSSRNALLIWSFPAAVLLVGGAILATQLRKWSKKKGVQHAGT